MGRTCFRCKEEKGDEEFYRDRGHATGFQRQCKECKKSKQAQKNSQRREEIKKTVTVKTCKKCGENKSLEHFPAHAKRRDGRGCYCEACLTPPPKKEKPFKPQPKDSKNKICTKCEEEKPKIRFRKRYDGSGGLEAQCKKCRNKKRNFQRKKPPSRASLLIEINRELLKSEKKQCSKCMKPLDLSQFRKGGIRGSCKKCLTKKPTGDLEMWVIEKFREKKNRKRKADYTRERYHSDPLIKLRSLLGTRTALALRGKGWHKKSSIKKILGASIIEVKLHLENQFTEGMSWENHGRWHIDHIIPLASAKTEGEMIALAHHSNLQPLWAVDNLRKGAKIA